jgi:hypothetical protein
MKPTTPTTEPLPVLRSEVQHQIQAHLDGKLTLQALAGWAFNLFYAVETEERVLELGFENMLAEALDALMFSDEPAFTLSVTELRELVQQLNI